MKRDDAVMFVASFVTYDPETGVFRYKQNMHKKRAGAVAGGKESKGYWRLKIKGVEVFAHRVAWFLMTGRVPDQIDHKNLDRADNRWVNLRECSSAENCHNRRGYGQYLKGVMPLASGRFQAQIVSRGARHYLGVYDTEQMAHEAYVAKARELHGEFARFE